jgi:pimeloyl-ACP methyl ester carboxylesterase
MHVRSFRISRPDLPALNLNEWGCGDATFLLIHGFGDGGYIWNDFLPRLAPIGRAIAIDLRGHGDSDWDVHSRYGTASHLSDVDFVIDSLGLTNIVLIGHSLGGEIAIRLAAQRPKSVRGIIIVDAGPELNRVATTHIRKEFVAESRVYDEHLEYVAHLQTKLPLICPKLCWPIANSALRTRAQGGYELKRDPSMVAPAPSGANALPALWQPLKEVLCPALLVRGKASSVLPLSVASRMIDILPNGFFSSIELAGHAVMIDNPDDFADAALTFITEKLFSEPADLPADKPMR